MSNATAVKIDLGNNESLVRCVLANSDGTFTAVSFSMSRTFRTKSGAQRWLAKIAAM